MDSVVQAKLKALHIEDFGIACFCKEGGAPHESNTGTCKHIAEERVTAPVIEAGGEAEEAPSCDLCETETDEAVEQCSECETPLHPSCMESHECEKG